MKKISLVLTIMLAIILALSSCEKGVVENSGSPEKTPGPTDASGSPIPTEPGWDLWDTPVVRTENPDELAECLEALLSRFSGHYGFHFINFENGDYIGIRDKDSYFAAESSALPVNLCLYALSTEGLVNLEFKMKFNEDDRSGTKGDVSNGSVGEEYTLSELSAASLTQGDMSAVRMIIRYLGKSVVDKYLTDLGAVSTNIPIYTSPYDMALFMNEIAVLEKENPEGFKALTDLLKKNANTRLLSGMAGREVESEGISGNSPGLISYNDTGIIYSNGPGYAISIYADGVLKSEAIETISGASKAVYGFLNYGIIPVCEISANAMVPNRIVKSARPQNLGYFEEILIDSKIVRNYFDEAHIAFPVSSGYAEELGLATFRGNNYRDGGAWGTADIKEEKLEIIWDFDIGSISTQSGGYWPGVGWTGQPSIVDWSHEVEKTMNIKEKFIGTDFKEVIYATLDGNIYFCDLETGEWTRNPIKIGYPTKGSVSIDARGYPLLYTGQGIGENGTDTLVPAYRIFSLIDQSLLYEIKGNDPDSFRDWPNFDSSGLLDAQNDVFYEAGENGIIYKMKLNTDFDISTGKISINPEVVKYRYLNPFGERIGIESSPAIYRNYMYFTDNNGMVACLDLKNMRVLWAVETGDDTDSTPVIEETAEGVFLYTGNQVDISGEMDKNAKGEYEATLSKYNALTGELVWAKKYMCRYNSVINGGVLGTPVVGKHEIDGIVIFPLAKYGGEYNGKLVALDKKTGEEVWSLDSEPYSWSSPTAVYTPEGKAYILYCNFAGNMYLLEGKTGRILDVVSLGANIEGTPGVYNDIAVVGSYARKIFGIRIK
ncbi:MAG: serine hydrolase [Clostridia bacterium]